MKSHLDDVVVNITVIFMNTSVKIIPTNKIANEVHWPNLSY